MGQKADNGEKVKPETMTGKQRAFVDHWIAERFHGTRAAKLAGYQGDDSVLAQQASVNLRIPKIQRAIAAKLEGHGGSAVEVISQLLELARFSDPARFMAEGGKLDYAAVKQGGHLIQSIHKMKDGWRIQTYSRLEALKELAKLLRAAGEAGTGEEWAGEVRVTFLGLAQQGQDKQGEDGSS